MPRFAPAVQTTVALAALLGTAWPVNAQHHPGGPHGGPVHPGYYYPGGFYHHYGYPYWGYPGWFGVDINLGYPYGPYYPALYPPPVVVTAPPPVVVVPPPPGTPPAAAAPSAAAPPAAPPLSEPLPAPTRADNLGHVHVVVPANALLWFNNIPTTQTGSERDFTTPPLPPGGTSTYDVKAQWLQDGRPVERTLQVEVHPNRTTTVDFNAPPPAKG